MKLYKVITGKFKKSFERSNPTDYSLESINRFLKGKYTVAQLKVANRAINSILNSTLQDEYINLEKEDQNEFLSTLTFEQLKEIGATLESNELLTKVNNHLLKFECDPKDIYKMIMNG